MTWCSEDSATPRFVLASSAIRCRFVDRFVRLRVLSRVSRQRFSSHDTPLPSIGSRRVRFPDVSGHIEVLRLPGTHPRSLIGFASGVHANLLGSCLAACARAPGRSEEPSGPGSMFNRRPDCRFALTWTCAGSPRFPGDPSCAFASVQDPGRIDDPSPTDGSVDAAPTRTTEKASAY